MSEFLTDKYLKYMAALRGKPIEDDTQCEYCGYNLKGLRYGKACPECGTPIRYHRHPDLAFDEMPLPLIKGFRLSCWMSVSAIGAAVVVLVTGAVRTGYEIGLVLLLAVVAMWVASVWRLTRPLDLPQAIAHGFSPRSRLRNAARWLQGGWILAVGAKAASTVQAAAGGPAILFDRLAFGGVLVGIVGLGALALFLARFAAWVRNEFAAKAFNLAVWGTALLGVMVLLLQALVATIGGLVFFLVPFVAVLIVVLFVACVLAFPVGLYSLSRSVDWSVVHAEDRADRGRRMRSRMASRPPPVAESTEPIQLAGPSSEPAEEPPDPDP
jgi:hypothetical protein